MKLSSKPAAILLGLALAFSASAQAALEGVDYEVLKKPIPQQDASKIEVLEFFDYSCILATTLILSCCRTAKLSQKTFTCVANTSSGCLKC